MDLAEAFELLATVQAFDRRTVGEVDGKAWQAALRDLPLLECTEAVVLHFTEDDPAWLMPGRVRALVRRARRDAIERAPLAVPAADPDDVPAYLQDLRQLRHRDAGQRQLPDGALSGVFRSVPRATPAAIEAAKQTVLTTLTARKAEPDA